MTSIWNVEYWEQMFIRFCKAAGEGAINKVSSAYARKLSICSSRYPSYSLVERRISAYRNSRAYLFVPYSASLTIRVTVCFIHMLPSNIHN